jgi:hypothetical protein
MSRKPGSLSSLGSRLQQKPAAAVAEPEPRQVDAVPSARRSTQPDGRRGILVRARPEAWKALKLVALDLEMTLQDLMVEAINDVLTKHGRPPVA